MKKTILILLISITVLKLKSNAQSITCSQLFPDSTIPHLSMGGGKMGWVTRNGSHYQHHIMDTLLNITSFQDTNLTYRALNGTGLFMGNYFCGSTMDKNGNLIGLFFDDACFSDSLQSPTSSAYPGFICYYWYNFSTQLKTYFSVTDVADQFFPLLSPGPTDTKFNYKIIWSGDTLILRSGYFNNIFPNGVCLKFLNYNLVEHGATTSNEGNILKCFTDFDHKINTLYESHWIQSDGVNYFNNMVPYSSFHFFSDAINDSIGNIYIKFNDSLRIKNNTSDVTISAPATGHYTKQSICVDHLNRLWMISDDTASVYENSAWTSYPLNFNNFENSDMQLAGWHSVFFEYAPNKFVMSWATDIGIIGGNGLIFFTFNDSSTVTSNTILKSKTQVKIYPNPASNILVIEQLFTSGNIIIRDVLGKELISTNITNNREIIDVSSLNNGIYFVNINNVEIQKIVIHK